MFVSGCCVSVCIYAYVCVSVYVYVWLCACVCICAHGCLFLCVYARKYVHVYACAYVCMFVWVRVSICEHVCVFVYVRFLICIVSYYKKKVMSQKREISAHDFWVYFFIRRMKNHVIFIRFFLVFFFLFFVFKKMSRKTTPWGLYTMKLEHVRTEKKMSFQFSFFILFDKMIFIMLFDNKFICASLIK